MRDIEARHDFVTGSNVTGPSVFVDGVATVAKNDVGPHHRWASGSGGVTLDAGPVGIGVDAGTLTIHRPMTGPGELVKLGAGRLVLAGGLSVAGGYLAGNYLPSAAAATATVASVPEPGSFGLAGIGILAASLAGRLEPSRECMAG